MKLKKNKMKRPITPEIEAKLRAEYRHKGTNTMARELGIGETSCIRMMRDLGLKRTHEELERIKQQSYFKKGQKAWNKGKRIKDHYSPETLAKMQRTQFKKGELPWNTSESDISIRNDKRGVPYYMKRISYGNWAYLHVCIYESKHGKVPKGYNVVFKDGNTMNVEESNLEKISDAELMRRNIHDQDPEILKAKKMITRINKKLKE